MPRDISETFLEDSKNIQLRIKRKNIIYLIQLNGITTNLIMIGKLLDQIMDGGGKADLLQDRWAQFPGKPAHILDYLVNIRNQVVTGIGRVENFLMVL